jgi:DNA-binding HxlR family transcriptional regulator
MDDTPISSKTAPTTPADADTEALVRDMIQRIADRWTWLVLEELGEGTLRFSQLRAAIPEVSQKMLTHTLRQLERDGLIVRHAYPMVPPRVDYALTPLGHSLAAAFCGVWMWAEEHVQTVHDARKIFEGKHLETIPASAPVPKASS